MLRSDQATRATYLDGILRWMSTVVAEGFSLVYCLRRRRRLYRMQRLDDHMLDDIGVTREELLWAINLPLRVNAALEMHDRAKARRATKARLSGEGRPSAEPPLQQSPLPRMMISDKMTQRHLLTLTDGQDVPSY